MSTSSSAVRSVSPSPQTTAIWRKISATVPQPRQPVELQRRTPGVEKPHPLQKPAPSVFARLYEERRQEHGLLAMPSSAIDGLLLQLPELSAQPSMRHFEASLPDHLARRFGWQQITLVPPGTDPTSNRVYMVQSQGVSVAAVKLYLKYPHGLFQELAANEALEALDPALSTVPILDAGKVEIAGVAYGILILAAAPGHDLEVEGGPRRNLDESRYIQALERCGNALRVLHEAFARSDAKDLIAQVRGYHADYVQNLTAGLVTLAERFGIDKESMDLLTRYIDQAATEYRQTDLQKLPIGVAHGDCYPANWIYGPSDRLHVIDLHTLMWSLGPEREPRGIADVREDIGRFFEAILALGFNTGADEVIVRARLQAFLRGYNSRARIRMSERDVEFFRLRYDAVVLGATIRSLSDPTTPMKFTQETARSLLLNLLQRARAPLAITETQT